MYQIIIVPKDTGATACMYYNAEDRAIAGMAEIRAAIASSVPGLICLSDDFGFQLGMDVSALSYAMFIDCNKASMLPRGQAAAPNKRIYDS